MYCVVRGFIQHLEATGMRPFGDGEVRDRRLVQFVQHGFLVHAEPDHRAAVRQIVRAAQVRRGDLEERRKHRLARPVERVRGVRPEQDRDRSGFGEGVPGNRDRGVVQVCPDQQWSTWGEEPDPEVGPGGRVHRQVRGAEAHARVHRVDQGAHPLGRRRGGRVNGQPARAEVGEQRLDERHDLALRIRHLALGPPLGDVGSDGKGIGAELTGGIECRDLVLA